jgi:PAS domain-containing protein
MTADGARETTRAAMQRQAREANEALLKTVRECAEQGRGWTPWMEPYEQDAYQKIKLLENLGYEVDYCYNGETGKRRFRVRWVDTDAPAHEADRQNDG